MITQQQFSQYMYATETMTTEPTTTEAKLTTMADAMKSLSNLQATEKEITVNPEHLAQAKTARKSLEFLQSQGDPRKNAGFWRKVSNKFTGGLNKESREYNKQISDAENAVQIAEAKGSKEYQQALKDGKETYSTQTESGKRLAELRASVEENSDQVVDKETGELRDLTDVEKQRKTSELLHKKHTGTKASFLKGNYDRRLQEAELIRLTSISRLESDASLDASIDITGQKKAINEQYLATKKTIDANFITATTKIKTLDLKTLDLDNDGRADAEEDSQSL